MDEIVNELNIENMIYEVRGKQVMLDSDLAKLYEVETKRINEAVKNNLEKFPNRFSFKLSKTELSNFLVENFDQKNIETRGGRYSNPRFFTEQGVAMLATVLKSRVATEVSIKIMDAFVAMRSYILTNVPEQRYITNLVLKHDEQLTRHEKNINDIFDCFESKNPKNEIYLSGQVYDAYSKIIDILFLAKNSITIIDSYADKYVLDMISKVNVSVTIVLSTKSRLSELDINKYNQEYDNLTLIYNDTFHDRFIILDNKKLYNLGTSLNNAGVSTFMINKIKDERLLSVILDILK
mgnify:CR=1 FL=1